MVLHIVLYGVGMPKNSPPYKYPIWDSQPLSTVACKYENKTVLFEICKDMHTQMNSKL